MVSNTLLPQYFKRRLPNGGFCGLIVSLTRSRNGWGEHWFCHKTRQTCTILGACGIWSVVEGLSINENGGPGRKQASGATTGRHSDPVCTQPTTVWQACFTEDRTIRLSTSPSHQCWKDTFWLKIDSVCSTRLLCH